MGRFVLGAAALFALASLGGGMARGVQEPQPGWDPTSHAEGHDSATFAGDISCTGSFWWRLQLNYQGTLKYKRDVYVSTSGGTVSVTRDVTDMDTWGMSSGNHLDCLVKAWYWTEWWGNTHEWDCDIVQT